MIGIYNNKRMHVLTKRATGAELLRPPALGLTGEYLLGEQVSSLIRRSFLGAGPVGSAKWKSLSLSLPRPLS